MLDYLITNGKIVDGSGKAPCYGEIGVEGDAITLVSENRPEGGPASDKPPSKTVIDAAGLTVTPGFIDIHCHSDAIIFHKKKNPKRLLQGFTTEVTGNCGISPAPVVPERLDLLKRYCAPTYANIPLPYDWKTLGDYLDAVEACEPVLNTATLAGHGSLRIAVAGFDDRQLTSDEFRTMGKLLEESLEQGAFGMSTGLFYTPGFFADEEEIITLAGILASHDAIYTTHMRSESEGLIPSIQETLRVTSATGVNTEISHLKASGRAHFGKVREALRLIGEARQSGLRVNYDVYPYVAANTMFASILPPWILEGGTEKMLSRLESSRIREETIRDLRNEGRHFENLYSLSGWDKILINECSVDAYVGKTIEQIAAENRQDPFEAALEVIRESGGNAMMIITLMSEQDVAEVLCGEYGIACTDGFPAEGKCHPRYTSSFIRILEKYVRQEHLLSLQEAVHKMSGMPAEKVGIRDRGLLKEGYKADILAFDMEHLTDNADYDRCDELATGMKYVMINGKLAMDNGVDRKICAGRVLRKNG